MIKSVKKIFFVAMFFFSVCNLYAQIGLDTDDYFYTLVESWENRGLVTEVPPLRPYTLNNIQYILQNIVKRGNEKDVQIAIEYWQKLTGKPWNLSASVGATGKASVEKNRDDDVNFSKLFTINPSVEGDMYLYKDLISMSYDLGLVLRTDEVEQDFLPTFKTSNDDAWQDPADLGPFWGYIDLNDVASFGTKDIFIQAGIYRTGYGPFKKAGIALNESSYHSANLSLSVLRKKWSYVQQYSVIGATSSSSGANLAPNKFSAFHAFEYKFSPKFSAAYYESIVYGGRFDFSYFVPAPYMAAQGLGGNGDNLQMGLLFKYRPFNGMLLALDVFADDIDVNSLVKFNINSKNRFALQTGVIYTPENSACVKMDLHYTAIMPYTYSHWQYASDESAAMTSGMYNYQNYTNNGIPIGSTIPPNSDGFSYSVEFMPTKSFRLKLGAQFIRHANIVESDTDDEALEYLLSPSGVYATDGSLFTHSMFANADDNEGKHVDTAWEQLNFLNQDTKMYVFTGTVEAEYTLPSFKMGTLSFNASYTFEYIHNKGVDSALYPGGYVKDNGNGTYSVSGISGTYTKSEVVNYFKERWQENLYDVLNNYLSIGINFIF